MNEALFIVMRVVHIGSAIALLGGAVFFLVVMLPSVRLVEEGLRGSILQLARKRFLRISHPAIVLLLISGFYNYLTNMEAYKPAAPAVHAVMGIKILLALAVTVILFAQAFKLLPGCPSRWAMVNVGLGATIVILAAVVRAMRMGVL